MVMHWIDKATEMRRGGLRIVQIAEILGLPPAKVKDALEPKYSYAPAPLPLPLSPETPRERVRKVVLEICDRHGMKIDDVLGQSRKREIVAARRDIAIYLRGQGWSYSQIARYIGKADHTTIIALVRGGKGKRNRVSA